MKIALRILLLLVIAGVAGGAYWRWSHPAQAAEVYQFGQVNHGTIQQTITATGTVEPEETVDIGAQVAGQIMEFGKDPHDPTKTVDYGTQVEEGTILAKIDPSLSQSDVDQYQAQLDSAEASVKVAQANLEQDKAKLVQAQNDWDRAQKLGAGEALAKSEYDGYEATYLTAKANVGVGDATVAQAQAEVGQATANLVRAKRNLGYCIITSPVKGVVIDRRVNIGQTVVSSLSAPSLFLIAKDLTKIQVWISVNEADIGRIHVGMPVTFQVDAFPDREFQGTVGKIRLNATMSQNVVTYIVEVNSDNPDGTLLPYMTANARFIVAQQDDTLIVPNSALRWHPRDTDQADAATASLEANTTAAAPAAGEGRRGRGGVGGAGKPFYVWVMDGTTPRPISVHVGISDGVNSAVTGDLTEGEQIITGTASADNATADTATTNPFAPTFFRGGRGGGTRGAGAGGAGGGAGAGAAGGGGARGARGG